MSIIYKHIYQIEYVRLPTYLITILMEMVLSGNKRALVCNLVFKASNTDIAPTEQNHATAFCLCLPHMV